MCAVAYITFKRVRCGKGLMTPFTSLNMNVEHSKLSWFVRVIMTCEILAEERKQTLESQGGAVKVAYSIETNMGY